MSDRLAHLLAVEIWPCSMIRLPLWLRVVVCLGWVPLLCMAGLLLTGGDEPMKPVRQAMVLLAMVYPPVALVVLGLGPVLRQAARQRK
jgi:hypothetical protein